MSEDIVERLREKQRRCKGSHQHATWTLCADAMAEINRLRRLVCEMSDYRAALPEKG